MKNYTLFRFVKLNLYFFAMYSLLTAVWYGFTGRFETDGAGATGEILFNAALFALLFSAGILLWYKRAETRIPVKELSIKTLHQRLEQLGYQKIAAADALTQWSKYKPVPPKVPVLAGKIFVQKKANFYLVEGPSKYIKKLGTST